MTVIPAPSGVRRGLIAHLPGEIEPLAPESVPLTGVRIDVQAQGVASAVTVTQRYVNLEKVPVEAVYSFPLEEQAAVCGFEALVGEQRIVGEVMEKDKAFDEYDEALADGNGAYLLDQDRPNVFTASIGNLLPGQQAVVTVKYVARLERLGDQVRLKIPTTVAPRYIPEEQLRHMDPSEFDHLNPSTVPGGVPYGLALSVSFTGASVVTAVECPSHPVRVSTSGESAKVELSGPDVQLDQDVVLTFTMEDAGATALYATQDDAGDTILMLDVLPPRDVKRGPVEAVFVIDRSGSMMGSSIDQARAALLLALGTLQPGDRFNVIGFGSTVDRLFPQSVAYDDTALAEARSAVGRWDADLGGTAILRPLREVLEAPAGDLPRRLLVLTDGEVANEEACFEVARRHPEATVFTIGVGYGASDHLVRGLARAGRGQAEFVHPGERIEAALMRQMARLTTVGLLEPIIDWGGLQPDLVAPAQLPPLYPGTPLTVFARVPAARRAPGEGDRSAAAGSARPVQVTLTATGPDGETRLTAAADLGRAAADEAVPRLFAREAIRDLEEGRGAVVGGGSRQRDRQEARVKDTIVSLATRYALMSSYTSFVAVEKRDAGEASDLPPAELRRIPVALLKDWHGTSAWPRILAKRAAMPAVSRRDLSIPVWRLARTKSSMECAFMEDAESMDIESLAFSLTSPAVRFKRDDTGSAELVAFMGRQRADGSWRLDSTTFARVGVPEAKLTAVAVKLRTALAADDDAVATVLAIYLLERQFSRMDVRWRLAADKAEAWLAARGLPGGLGAVRSVLDEAMAWWTPVSFGG